ncbi:MAG: FAD-dependent oxidoreductase [Acidimicrobiales bacterium]|nr:FAD-dependent oxidoreductase [Acidimicrobiales bacterium]
MPGDPVVAWRFPDDRMCSMTSISGEQQQWCGMGWTGQPAVFERGGRTWVVFGAYDAALHFVDGETGERLLPDFPTGDIIKGSVTVDPDGYPLVYAGSRDDRLRVLAFDRDEPVELWSLHAYDVEPTMWNNDWDSSPLVLDDHLFAGGENSRFHVVRLNRGYDADGLVTVDPEMVWDVAGWDDELLDAVGGNVSIETSPLVIGDVLYFANSGGLVQGWDIGGLRDGVEPTRVFRFWAGDDVDATLVADDVVALKRRPGAIELATRGGETLRAERVLVATGGFTNASRMLERRLALSLHGVTVVLVEAPSEPRPEIPSVTFVVGGKAGPRTGFAMPPLRYPDGRYYIKGATASSVDSLLDDGGLVPWYRGAGAREDGPQLVALLREVLPSFVPGEVRTLPCMVAYTPSGLPYVDRVDERVGIAVGGNACGVMTSDELGRLAAAMMRDAPWTGPLGAELFSARFA